MGFFRILFALIVLGGHLKSSLFFFNGELAVKSFFVISGFYMSLILNEKYINKNKSYLLFITNRILRIYPIYLLILAIYISIYIHHFHFKLDHTVIFPIIDNILLFVNPSNFIGGISVLGNIFMAPSWTLGLEMNFYFLSPLILQSWKKSVLVFIGSILLRYFGNHSLLGDNLFYFMIGSMSYLLYAKVRATDLYKKKAMRVIYGATIVFILIPYIFFISSLHLNSTLYEVISLVYFFSFASVIPPSFLFFSKNWLDHFLGDLSYPIYISHVLVFYVFTRVLYYNENLYDVLSIVTVIVFSKLLLIYVDNPIQNYRSSRIKAGIIKHFQKHIPPQHPRRNSEK